MSTARKFSIGLLALLAVVTAASAQQRQQPQQQQQQQQLQQQQQQQQPQQKPNILFIMGDDIGWMQPSIYHQGLMVGETPNIDRIGQEGAKFTDYYAEQSCTAGRTAFFTGMNPLRVGM
ncbi:MAG: sulfatase-like hydrolase/transferase, partial [Rhodoplanes sp.]